MKSDRIFFRKLILTIPKLLPTFLLSHIYNATWKVKQFIYITHTLLRLIHTHLHLTPQYWEVSKSDRLITYLKEYMMMVNRKWFKVYVLWTLCKTTNSVKVTVLKKYLLLKLTSSKKVASRKKNLFRKITCSVWLLIKKK